MSNLLMDECDAPTLQPFDGEIFRRGKANKVLAGDHTQKIVTLLKFANLEKAHKWYESAAYQALTLTRDEAADITAISYEELTF